MNWFKQAQCCTETPSSETLKSMRDSDLGIKLTEYVKDNKMVDTQVYLSPDLKSVVVSVGDSEGNYDYHEERIKNLIGPEISLEVCDECGKPEGYNNLMPTLGESFSFGEK